MIAEITISISDSHIKQAVSNRWLAIMSLVLQVPQMSAAAGSHEHFLVPVFWALDSYSF